MANRPEREGYDGLSKVAHAVRRSAALIVAAQITDPEPAHDAEERMLACMERLASAVGGQAQQVEDEDQQEQSRPGPLGEAWPPPD
jgi:hypothetical protein